MDLPLRENAGVVIGAVSGRIDHANADAFNVALEPLLKGCVGGSEASGSGLFAASNTSAVSACVR
jgi:hypothetical protein